MSVGDKQAFVDSLAREYGQRLRSFLAARLRYAAADVPDLVQEVYLRLMRVPSHESIRSPQAYLFTVALHVLHQHKLSRSSGLKAVAIGEALAELEARPGENPATRVEVFDQLEAFDQVLSQLPARPYAIFVLHRQCGYTREEIAAELGMSLAMVKKNLAIALAHCRRHFEAME